jgi:hypothetical protein
MLHCSQLGLNVLDLEPKRTNNIYNRLDVAMHLIATLQLSVEESRIKSVHDPAVRRLDDTQFAFHFLNPSLDPLAFSLACVIMTGESSLME